MATKAMKMKCSKCGEFKADQTSPDLAMVLNGAPICAGCIVILALQTIAAGA